MNRSRIPGEVPELSDCDLINQLDRCIESRVGLCKLIRQNVGRISLEAANLSKVPNCPSEYMDEIQKLMLELGYSESVKYHYQYVVIRLGGLFVATVKADEILPEWMKSSYGYSKTPFAKISGCHDVATYFDFPDRYEGIEEIRDDDEIIRCEPGDILATNYIKVEQSSACFGDRIEFIVNRPQSFVGRKKEIKHSAIYVTPESCFEKMGNGTGSPLYLSDTNSVMSHCRPSNPECVMETEYFRLNTL